jgi:hypothetical protein
VLKSSCQIRHVKVQLKANISSGLMWRMMICRQYVIMTEHCIHGISNVRSCTASTMMIETEDISETLAF